VSQARRESRHERAACLLRKALRIEWQRQRHNRRRLRHGRQQRRQAFERRHARSQHAPCCPVTLTRFSRLQEHSDQVSKTTRGNDPKKFNGSGMSP